MKKRLILLACLSLMGLAGCAQNPVVDPTKTIKVSFYVDFSQTTAKYVLDAEPGKNISLPNEAKLTDADALDPAFPYFLGYSIHPMVDSTNDLWKFDSDIIPIDATEFTLYGVWVENK